MLDHKAEGPSKAAPVLVLVDTCFFLFWIKNIQDEGSSQHSKKKKERKKKNSIKREKGNTGFHVEHVHVQILTQL